MTPSRRPTVVLWSSPDTLTGIDARLQRSGIRLVRLVSVETQPVDPQRWIPSIVRASPPPDTVVVTSRVAVDAGVRPWRRATGRGNSSPEFWAVGPGTAAALRQAGVRRVRRPSGVGATAVAHALGRSAPRNVLYLRSDRAGPQLARALRAARHRVRDVVVYRLRPARRITARARQELRDASALIVTSPSGFSELRRQLGLVAFTRLARSTTVVVLGERSRRSARRYGFRHASVAPSTSPYRFSRHLLRELDDVRT